MIISLPFFFCYCSYNMIDEIIANNVFSFTDKRMMGSEFYHVFKCKEIANFCF